MRTAELQIRTPEGIVFSQLLAGPVTRCIAWMLDFFCVLVLVMLLSRITSFLGILSANIATAFYTLGYFILSIGYGITCEWAWRGQTVGKRLFRLRVIDVEGMRLQFNQIVTRNLLRFVDALPVCYFVGGLSCILTRHCQRLGDIAANTVVVRYPRVMEPDVEQLLSGKFNSLRAYPHLAARLRQRVAPGEAAVALQALLRRDQFDPVARIELFSELATHFQAKVQFPSEATDGITDEQFLRNVVDVIYRARAEAVRPVQK
jgi:uncharacterized RDD family membrane protein YckC